METKLLDLIDNRLTDKNTIHSYIEPYEEIFNKKKYNNNNILEIGIGEPLTDNRNGGSIKLWHDYFVNSTIYGIDIHDISKINDIIKNNERIKLLTGKNAYDIQFIKQNFISQNIKFDIMIDDGPHTYHSMKFFVEQYLPLLNPKGILIIEDIPNISWCNKLINSVPSVMKNQVIYRIYDLRNNKKRFDDILLIFERI